LDGYIESRRLEDVQESEVRNTWVEILGQSLASMSRTLGSLLRQDVTLETGMESAPSFDAQEWATAQYGGRSSGAASGCVQPATGSHSRVTPCPAQSGAPGAPSACRGGRCGSRSGPDSRALPRARIFKDFGSPAGCRPSGQHLVRKGATTVVWQSACSC